MFVPFLSARTHTHQVLEGLNIVCTYQTRWRIERGAQLRQHTWGRGKEALGTRAETTARINTTEAVRKISIVK